MQGGLALQILVGFFFKGPPKNKKKFAAKTKMLTLKKKKKAPKLEGPRGIFPTSLYGQSAR
jgi:hypothetical protein